MQRGSWIVALAALCLSGAASAAEPGICKSVCDTERRSCKANVDDLAAEKYEGPIVVEPRERNGLARTAQQTQGGPDVRLVENQGGVQDRRMRYRAACEDKYARCTRACSAPANPDSPVIVKRGKSG